VPKDEPPDLGEHARRAYQESADRYVGRAETNLWNAHWDRPVIRSLLPPIAGKRVLDAGCAGDANTEWLLDQGASVVALDITPRMIELTQRRVGDRADVHLHDLREPMGFLVDRSIDIVLSSLTIPVAIHYALAPTILHVTRGDVIRQTEPLPVTEPTHTSRAETPTIDPAEQGTGRVGSGSSDTRRPC
jgi:SAM-dependent methyltransferase